ncbi:MAG: hypothetical protein J6K75_05050 [Erysipelotrichaceae bacterium]|nr:hypothetical protein [Erysipelotrichaceae bacterium]
MKVKIAAAAGILVLVLGGFLLLKPDSFENKAEKLREETVSYQMSGSMELTNSEDLKSYAITSSWMKTDEGECFKVEMTDKTLNQQQIILKNHEGVFVITPSLNQVFKFQGEWPTNSPKPYLLQTMLDLLEHEEVKCTNNSDGYLIEAPAVYPSATSLVMQQVQFSKDMKPLYLRGYNADNVCELTMTFSQVDYNIAFEEDYFKQPVTSIHTAASNYLEEADLPLYPMAVFDAKLVNSTVSNVDGGTEHVLEFSGDRAFTVVEKQLQSSDELELIEINGELIEALGSLYYYNGNKLTAISTQMEMSVYSDDLSVMEMLQVLQSMQVSIMK